MPTPPSRKVVKAGLSKDGVPPSTSLASQPSGIHGKFASYSAFSASVGALAVTLTGGIVRSFSSPGIQGFSLSAIITYPLVYANYLMQHRVFAL